MTSHSSLFPKLLADIKQIAHQIAAQYADDVDKAARFPHETFAALKQAQILSALIPLQLEGGGCSLYELGQLCSTLAQACGASGMILAMHYIQVACLLRHGVSEAFFVSYIQQLVQRQYLLASMTSEVGTWGNTRTSICAPEPDVAGRFTLKKEATTGSYCAYADAILVTCRRDAVAAASDQILVLLQQSDYTLEQTTSWDTLGMRGTCSPGFKLQANGAITQILPGSFADSAAQTMVPYSHILWSAVWCGIATDAVARAASYVRQEARKNPGQTPPTAMGLAEVSVQLQTMRQNWVGLAREFDELAGLPTSQATLASMGWALKMNNLKVSASQMAPQIIHAALQIVGILAYKNDSKFSLGRHYRDVLSASLMISNERIAAKSASMLLVLKDD